MPKGKFVKIRAPSTTVELVHILGDMLRTKLKINVAITEGWTFEPVAEWTSYGANRECSKQNALYWEHVANETPKHFTSIYLCSGCCYEGISSHVSRRLDLRARCERYMWDSAGIGYWIIQLWVKHSDGLVESIYHEYDFGDTKDNARAQNTPLYKMKEAPPKCIAFK